MAAPNQMVTAAHVINDPSKGEAFQHKDGDRYYLLQHDDEDAFHFCIFEPKLNNAIFVFPEQDLGIIYLDDEFYQVGDKVFVDRNDFIRISKDFLPIGSDIGVLGYPVCELGFENRDLNKPKIGNVFLRTDRGVINCRYKTSESTFLYEFTMAFNPGNSGGPIFDVRTGRVISIVKGYKAIPINQKEHFLSEDSTKQLKLYKEKAYIETLHATYSVGFVTPSFLEIFKQHQILS